MWPWVSARSFCSFGGSPFRLRLRLPSFLCQGHVDFASRNRAFQPSQEGLRRFKIVHPLEAAEVRLSHTHVPKQRHNLVLVSRCDNWVSAFVRLAVEQRVERLVEEGAGQHAVR